jgi:hypothetical protein
MRLYRVKGTLSSDNGYVISGNSDLLSTATVFQVKTDTTTTPGTTVITYSSIQPLPKGYYVLAVTCNTATDFNTATFTYQSDPYTCPYDSQFPDYNSNF